MGDLGVEAGDFLDGFGNLEEIHIAFGFKFLDEVFAGLNICLHSGLVGWNLGFVQLYQEGIVKKLDFGYCPISEEVEDVGLFVVGVFY